MEQESLVLLKETLKELREKVLNDEDIKGLFNKNHPTLDFEEHVDDTLAQLEEYAIEKDYNVLDLSMRGVVLFFSSILGRDEDEEDEEIHGEA